MSNTPHSNVSVSNQIWQAESDFWSVYSDELHIFFKVFKKSNHKQSKIQKSCEIKKDAIMHPFLTYLAFALDLGLEPPNGFLASPVSRGGKPVCWVKI